MYAQQVLNAPVSPDTLINESSPQDSDPADPDQWSKYRVCSNCKRLKRKCNRERPACSRCRASGYTCQYESMKRRPGPAKGSVSTKTKALTSKLNHLEGLLQDVRSQLGSQNTNMMDHDPQSSQLQVPTYQTDLHSLHLSHGFDQPAFLYPSSLPNTTVALPPQDMTDMESLFQFSLPLESNFLTSQIKPTLPLQQWVGPTADNNSARFFSVNTLAEESKQLLISLYFLHIQPMFPMFRKPTFEQGFRDSRIPESLLSAMFAVSARFVPEADMIQHFGQVSTPWEKFAEVSHRQSRDQHNGNDPICLDDIKTAALLAIYEYTTYPGRKAWMYVGNVTRLALCARLHQIDSQRVLTSLSNTEREEWRFVWWVIWKLDSTINVAAFSPFGIDCQSIGTAMVSTTVADFTNGIVNPSTNTLLETDPVKSWKSIRETLAIDPGDGFNVHLVTTMLLRAVSQCQQRLDANCTNEEIQRLMALRNTFSCMRLALPGCYFDGSKEPGEGFYAHRHRLETIVMFYTAQLIINEPVKSPGAAGESVSINSWRDSITCAEDLASVFHHWKAEYFAVADPIMSCAIYHAYCALTIYKMSIASENNGDLGVVETRIQNALDLLSISLDNFARWWEMARILQRSLETLQLWSWVQLDLAKLVDVVSQIRRAINPYAAEPGLVDVSLICPPLPHEIDEEVMLMNSAMMG